MQKALIRTLIVLLIAMLLLFFGQYNKVLTGFIAGTAVSAVNGFLLYIWIKRITEWKKVFELLGGSVPSGDEQIGPSRRNLLLIKFLFQMGFFVLRWIIIIGVLFLVVKFNWFNLLAMLGGLFVLPAFAVIEVLDVVFSLKPQKGN